MLLPSEVHAGVDLKTLRAGSLLDVETQSRHYRIELLPGNAIRVSGHPQYCPEPKQARLHGSVNEAGVVEEDVIEPGMRLMFFFDDRNPVTTSRVVSVQVE
jgi:hypothetical protein